MDSFLTYVTVFCSGPFILLNITEDNKELLFVWVIPIMFNTLEIKMEKI